MTAMSRLLISPLGEGDDIFKVANTSGQKVGIEGRSGNDTFNIERTSTGNTTEVFGDAKKGIMTVGDQSFVIAPGDELFRVGSNSSSSDDVIRTGSSLEFIDGDLQIFAGGSNDQLTSDGKAAVKNANNHDGDQIIFYHGGGTIGNHVGTLNDAQLLKFGMDTGVSYTEAESITLRLSNNPDELFIENTPHRKYHGPWW